jgi:hypothetical protein
MSSRNNHVKRQLDYLSGGKTNYALLSSLRRSDFFSRKVKEDKQKLGSGMFDENGNQVKFFPDEYRKARPTNDAITNDLQAGITTLGIMKPTEKGWEIDKSYNKEIDFGGRLIRPLENQGVIRVLNSSVLKDNMETILEENNMVMKMVKLFLSDSSGNICRYVLPYDFYKELDDAGAVPEDISSLSPNTPEFAAALTQMKNVVKRALPSIHFEDSIDSILSSFGKDSVSSSIGGGCCCK